ncbi:MAG: NADH-quinone oxidoreductase subunit N [Thermoguttaceae bacterium]
MTFFDLVQSTLRDSLGTSIPAFAPELVLCATIVAILLARMFSTGRTHAAYLVMMAGSLAALVVALRTAAPEKPVELFTGMLIHDPFSLFMRRLLLLFVLLFGSMTRLSRVPDRETAPEFYVLVLGAVLGMCLMVSANHMLIVFLGIEMASVPSYALVGVMKNRRASTEAALKFAVFGGGAAGVMLYGISLLVGTLGTAHLPTMSVQLAALVGSAAGGQYQPVLALAGLMILAGFAFKLSVVPFHFWTPDAFEGATAEVAAFLSVASKAAALALLLRITLGLGHVAADPDGTRPVAVAASAADGAPGEGSPGVVADWRDGSPALEPVRQYMAWLIAFLAAVTCTFGNLAAYGQDNMKRLLAYSTIAHAGYMLMPVAAAIVLSGSDVDAARQTVAAIGFYLAVYAFMNLGAFALVAFLRNRLGSEELPDYAGLARRSPGLAVCAAVVMFSLVGLPPLAGFAAKFAIFAQTYRAGWLSLVVIGVINTVFSLFYYLRVVKTMVLDPEREGRPAPTIPLWSNAGFYCGLIALLLVVLGVFWNPLFVEARNAASLLLP